MKLLKDLKKHHLVILTLKPINTLIDNYFSAIFEFYINNQLPLLKQL